MNHASLVIWRTSGFSLSSALLPSRCSRISLTLSSNKTWLLGSPSANKGLGRAYHVLQRPDATSDIVRNIWKPQKLRSPGKQGRLTAYLGLGLIYNVRSFISGKESFGNLSEAEYQKSPNKLKPLSGSHIVKVLGPGIPKEFGNALLQQLQKQRITGTLDYEIEHEGVTEELIAKGLLWLRSNYPLDEEAAIIRRIELEEKADEEAYIARGERIGLYKPQEGNQSASVYGESQFDKIRSENEAKYEAELQEKAEREEKEAQKAAASGRPTAVQTAKAQAALARQEANKKWVDKYRQKAQLSQFQDMRSFVEKNKVSLPKLLIPTGIFVAATIALCVLWAIEYKPPKIEGRLFPQWSASVATLAVISAINVTVFLAWKFPPMWQFMNKYFLIIAATPRAVSAIGNIFSHQSASHLAINMFVLWMIGKPLHDEIGRGNFLALFIGGGVFASMASLSRFVLAGRLDQLSLGASGAVLSLIAPRLLLHPDERMRFIFLPDFETGINSLHLCFLLVAAELWGMARGRSSIDHYSHMGGFFAGVVASELFKYKAQVTKRNPHRWPKPYLIGRSVS